MFILVIFFSHWVIDICVLLFPVVVLLNMLSKSDSDHFKGNFIVFHFTYPKTDFGLSASLMFLFSILLHF